MARVSSDPRLFPSPCGTGIPFAPGAQRGGGHGAAPGDQTSAAIDEKVIESVLGALRGTGKPYLHTSGIWIYGDTDGEIDEDAPLAPPAGSHRRSRLRRGIGSAHLPTPSCSTSRPPAPGLALTWAGSRRGGLWSTNYPPAPTPIRTPEQRVGHLSAVRIRTAPGR